MSQQTPDLFGQTDSLQADESSKPLAARMRPQALEEFVGQSHLLGPGQILRRAIESDCLQSLILWGPPGCGKTALAHLVARLTRKHFIALNAVTSNVSELRQAITQARARQRSKRQGTILFLDEIHRFNKAQQDVLMPEVEEGVVVLIGATTHNPFFSIVSPLLSRSLVCELKALLAVDIASIVRRALADSTRGLGRTSIRMDEDALAFLVKRAEGDARRALNALELAALTTPAGPDGQVVLTRPMMEQSLQKKAVLYDRDEDAHYDTISAFIKSVRGSDPDAAVYWLAKMLYAGEDPMFIARRLVILASEDIGNADPQGLVVAQAAQSATAMIGMPEARIILAQATTYLASAPKSNASYLAIEAAWKDIESEQVDEVPDDLKDAHYRGAKKLGHGEGYQYPHDFPGATVEQAYRKGTKKYYQPTDRGFEKEMQKRLKNVPAPADAGSRPGKGEE